MEKIKRSNTESLFKELAGIVAPPPDLTVSEWADSYRRLSPESSSEPGQWRTSRAPYQQEILNAVSDASIRTVVVMTSSQVGKTELILNIIGYHIDYDPAPIMVVQPTLDMAKTFSKDRLAPMLRDTPVLRNKVTNARSRDSSNTTLHKAFPGGHITIIGANSPSGLASRPIRILLADEVDRFPVSAGTEGDPLTLARKRTNTFSNRKLVYVSTPTVKNASRIESEYLISTQEEWNLKCPSCGRYQPLKWAKIKFKDVTMECEYCKTCHDEFKWKQSSGMWVAENPGANSRGFHLNELSSPWKRWEEIIEEFKQANEERKKGNIESIKAWVNTSLGETWEEEGEGIETDDLMKRREQYNCEVPQGVLVLTAGVDVQDDRLEYEIVGWGKEKENWGIEYSAIYGDPGQNFVWKMLDEKVINRIFKRSDGQEMQVMTTAVDSGGHYTKEVYEYCRKREMQRVWAIKGQGGSGIPYIKRPKDRNEAGCILFTVGVDVGKDTLASRLKVEFEGPGYSHFPIELEKGYDERYFEGLTAEHRVIRHKNGKPVIVWEKRTSKARNEPFDLRNYATSALEILNPPLEKMAEEGKTSTFFTKTKKVKKRKVISKGIS